MTSEAAVAHDPPARTRRTQARADFYALLARLVRGSARRGAARRDCRGAAARARRAARTRRPRLAAAWDALARGSQRGATPTRWARSTRRSSSAWARARSASTPRTSSGRSRDGRWPRCAPRSPASGSRGGPRAASSRTISRSLLETMRMLVAGDAERPPAPIAEQRAFFERHLLPWALRLLHCNSAMSCCQLLPASRTIHACCFLAIERDSFAIE